MGQFSPFQQKGEEPKAGDTRCPFGPFGPNEHTRDCWLNMHSFRIFRPRGVVDVELLVEELLVEEVVLVNFVK